jgi:hypothetical protein
MESYAELEVSVRPFIVLPLETVLLSDYHIQKSVPCDKVSRQGGSGSKSAQSGRGGGGGGCPLLSEINTKWFIL